jgi:hypothetical protein
VILSISRFASPTQSKGIAHRVRMYIRAFIDIGEYVRVFGVCLYLYWGLENKSVMA